MHIGLLVKSLSKAELDGKYIFIDSYSETYGTRIINDCLITGLEKWFEKFPIKDQDTVIISKNAEGYELVINSEIIDQMIEEKLEEERVETLDPHAIRCPNCEYALEKVGEKKDQNVLACPRCGFRMVRKKKTN